MMVPRATKCTRVGGPLRTAPGASPALAVPPPHGLFSDLSQQSARELGRIYAEFAEADPPGWAWLTGLRSDLAPVIARPDPLERAPDRSRALERTAGHPSMTAIPLTPKARPAHLPSSKFGNLGDATSLTLQQKKRVNQ